MINLIGLKTKTVKYIPINEVETLSLKKEGFDEGWWKGWTVAVVGYILGQIIGEIFINRNK